MCCSDILPISQEEIDRLRDYAGKHPRVLRKTPEPGRCLFLRQLLGITYCSVHKVRPEICRVYNCRTPLNDMVLVWKEKKLLRPPQSMYEVMHR